MPTFHCAEKYHMQYLAKYAGEYCRIGGCGAPLRIRRDTSVSALAADDAILPDVCHAPLYVTAQTARSLRVHIAIIGGCSTLGV